MIPSPVVSETFALARSVKHDQLGIRPLQDAFGRIAVIAGLILPLAGSPLPRT